MNKIKPYFKEDLAIKRRSEQALTGREGGR